MRKQSSRTSRSGQPKTASTEFGKASSRWTPSESSAASRASMSPVWDPGIGSYWVSTWMNSLTRIGVVSAATTQPPSTFTTRGARSFIFVGNCS